MFIQHNTLFGLHAEWKLWNGILQSNRCRQTLACCVCVCVSLVEEEQCFCGFRVEISEKVSLWEVREVGFCDDRLVLVLQIRTAHVCTAGLPLSCSVSGYLFASLGDFSMFVLLSFLQVWLMSESWPPLFGTVPLVGVDNWMDGQILSPEISPGWVLLNAKWVFPVFPAVLRSLQQSSEPPGGSRRLQPAGQSFCLSG